MAEDAKPEPPRCSGGHPNCLIHPIVGPPPDPAHAGVCGGCGTICERLWYVHYDRKWECRACLRKIIYTARDD